ncbi:transcription elongation factor [Sporormia fimetaria CBS 119925]|uniref:Transcription elongation factor n=1 Tax=Sporormia fimetaria CBS 119925 TaxID=1340428 RepID=A0A6A6VLU9_9PLEO|nr:transcription elongation factor [Sporormia fimetaria CBS 119925]
MDVKEVELRGKSIAKAIAENEPSSSIIKLLNDLKTGVKATEDLLRQTKIGVTVNRLRTYKDPAVQKLAQELIGKWKEEVAKNKRRLNAERAAGTPSNSGALAASSPALPSGTASPAPAGGKRKHDVSPATRNADTDKIGSSFTGNAARDSCIKLMYNGLAFMSEELPSDILPVAKDVESAVWAYAGGADNANYRAKIRSLFQNLKSKSNPKLREHVYNGKISPKKFVSMSADELKSDARRAEDERMEKENMNEAMVAQVEKSVSKEFQCGKCKQKMVSYSQAQTRSADEPMTTFCECMNCGHRWKFS